MAMTWWTYQLLVLTIAWVGGFAPAVLGKLRWRWWQCVGLALVLVPFVRMGIGVYFDVVTLVQTTLAGGHVVLPAYSRAELWEKIGRHLWHYLLVPGVGLLLIWGGRPSLARLAAAGLAPKESPRRDILHGLALFFLIATAYVAALVFVYVLVPGLVATGDESQVWANITPLLIVLLSGVAGVTEEFLFRGLMLSSLQRRMPWIAAALVQAAFFGLVHAGYMTWAHVIGPFAFGFGMAWVVRHLGLLPAVLLHAEVNVAFFAFDVADVQPAAWWLLVALAALNAYAAYVTKFAAVKTLWRSIVPAKRVVEAPLAPPPMT